MFQKSADLRFEIVGQRSFLVLVCLPKIPHRSNPTLRIERVEKQTSLPVNNLMNFVVWVLIL